MVEQFNYRPSRIAQSLKTRESRNLALIVPDIQNPFYSSMADKIQNLLLREGILRPSLTPARISSGR